MHKVAVDPNKSTKPALRSEGDRDHAIKLIQMLAARMDSLSRTELFKTHAARHGMRDHLEIFEATQERDLSHIEWLKDQIMRSIE